MRKILITVIFILSASFCFGEWSLESAAGIPSYSSVSGNDFEVYNGYSFGISSRIKIVNNLGIGIHTNYMYFPKIFSGNGDGSMVINGKDCELSFGFDFLLGPSLFLYNNGRFRVPITVGFNGFGMFLYMKDLDVPVDYPLIYENKMEFAYVYVSYGVGFNISFEYLFTKRFYITGRIQGAFNFIYIDISASEIKTRSAFNYSSTTNSEEHHYGFNRMFGINPSIGVGLQF